MTLVLPQDTPITRASIRDMTPDQITALVELMQERRMRSQTAYQLAMEAKAKIKEERDKARYDKLLTMMGKKLEAVEKSLDVCSKYANELKLLEITQ